MDDALENLGLGRVLLQIEGEQYPPHLRQQAEDILKSDVVYLHAGFCKAEYGGRCRRRRLEICLESVG